MSCVSSNFFGYNLCAVRKWGHDREQLGVLLHKTFNKITDRLQQQMHTTISCVLNKILSTKFPLANSKFTLVGNFSPVENFLQFDVKGSLYDLYLQVDSN